MKFINTLLGKEKLLDEIAELKLEIRRLKRDKSSTYSGMKSIIGLDELVLQCDSKGFVEYGNTAFAQCCGIEKNDLPGKHYSEFDNLILEPGLLKKSIEETKDSNHIINYSFLDKNSDKQKYIEIYVSKQSDSFQLRIKDVSEIKNLEEMFGRYVSPVVIEKMKYSDKDFFKTERRILTVLFCDLRGFTSMSEKLTPEEVRNRINDYLSIMSEIIMNKYEATIDKFIGDEIMAMFGAPIPYEDHIFRAVKVSMELHKKQIELNKKWNLSKDNYRLIGVGINTGEMIIGNLGSKIMADYTVLGHNVNLASRLCDFALPGETLITEDTYNLLQQYFKQHPEDNEYAQKNLMFIKKEAESFKGVSQPLITYSIKDKNNSSNDN